MKRIYHIDLMRGIVMIIMALDHVRDLLHTTSITQSPTNLNTTTPELFATRWITHLCAPTFVFLSGTSAFLSMKSKHDLPATRKFLLTRGLWLIVLEFTLIGFGVWFDIHFNIFFFNVIGAIGLGFIILSLLLHATPKTIGIIGLSIICLHNLSLLIPAKDLPLFKKILMSFFAPGVFPLGGGRLFMVGYPPVPWLGIMLVGFASGRFFEMNRQKQQSLFFKNRIIRHWIICFAAVHQYIWRSCTMVVSKKQLVYIFVIYKCYEISAFPSFYVAAIGNHVFDPCCYTGDQQ